MNNEQREALEEIIATAESALDSTFSDHMSQGMLKRELGYIQTLKDYLWDLDNEDED